MKLNTTYIKLICLVIFTCCYSVTNAQDVFDLKGSGARAAGMGYAFIGVADDATASSWNPGGLTQIDNIDISLVSDYTINNQLNYSYDDGSGYTTNIPSRLTLNYASLVFPFELKNNKRFNVGLSLQNYVNYQWTYEEEELDKYYYETRYNNTLIYSASATIAYTITNYVSLGVSANYYFSTGNEWGGVHYENPDTGNYINSIDGYSGLNFNIGALVNLEESKLGIPLKLGIRCSTPFDLETTGQALVYHYGDFTAGYEIPMVLGIGASYRIGDNFTISLDYDMKYLKDKSTYYYGEKYYRNTAETSNYPFEKFNLINEMKDDSSSNISETNENIYQLRLGAEYNFSLSDKLVMPLRLGYKTGPTVSANYDEQGEASDLVNARSFHLGLGISHIDRFSFDIAYVNYNSTQEYRNTGLSFESPVSNLVASIIIYIGRNGDKGLDSNMDY